jgi:mRNA interferase MazF
VVRGDIYAVTLPRGRGRVQHGARYAVVVQADDLGSLSTVVICPTSQSARPASFHPLVTVKGEHSHVMCEMVGAVDSRMLGPRVDHLGWEHLRQVDAALALVLDLP